MSLTSKLFYFILLFTAFYGNSQKNKQTSHYKILTENQIYLGDLKATQIKHNDYLEIEVVSKTKVKVLVNITLKYVLHEIYDKNNILKNSHIQTFVNGHLHSNSTIARQDKVYHIKIDDKEYTYNKPIHYSGGLLYFKEPKNVKYVFSEFHGIEKPIKTKTVHEYLITNPLNGKTNSYYYNKGGLVKSIFNHKLMSVIIEKID